MTSLPDPLDVDVCSPVRCTEEPVLVALRVDPKGTRLIQT